MSQSSAGGKDDTTTLCRVFVLVVGLLACFFHKSHCHTDSHQAAAARSLIWPCMIAVTSAAASTTSKSSTAHANAHAFAVVEPVEGTTRLKLNAEGLNVLKRIHGAIVPVVVIGPYRSGKSFTLNQLMEVPCDVGFGVGHTRQTQTKGIWVWGEPLEVTNDAGETVNLVFVDTEGFESTGKTDVYDDRIFALSTLMSQVLIYNLPESIRESDLEKLSFASELAKAFYASSTNGDVVHTVDPTTMVWLIQRDFLEGDSLQRTLEKALQRVPNPDNDKGISQLNHIREGLEMISKSSTAIGLPQPHLDRTKLCELDESEFDPGYVRQRDVLREFVRRAAHPKFVGGKALDGAGLVDLIRQTVTALNEKEFPTASSMVHYFNKDLVALCKDMFSKQLAQQRLPVDESEIESKAATISETVMEKFRRDRFGTDVDDLERELKGLLNDEVQAQLAANELASSKTCEQVEMECEESMEREANQPLPSTSRFKKKYEQCKEKFDRLCVGPGKFHNAERLAHAWERELTRFNKEFNDKLLNGIVIISIALVVIFRFVIRWGLGETFGWILFIFLQIYPRTFIGSSSSMFDTKGWGMLTKAWETVVDNPILDLQKYGIPGLVIVLVLYVCRSPLKRIWVRFRGVRRRTSTTIKGEVDGKDLDV